MVGRPVRLGVRNPSGTRYQFIFLLEIFFRQLWVCYFVAPSLTRGWVCNLLLLLALGSEVPLGSDPRDSRPYFIVPILETPNLEGQVPIFMYSRNRVAQCPRALGSVSVTLQHARLRLRYFILPPHRKVIEG
jgi:hypothetical protein